MPGLARAGVGRDVLCVEPHRGELRVRYDLRVRLCVCISACARVGDDPRVQGARERRAEAVRAVRRVHREPRELVVVRTGGARRADSARGHGGAGVGASEPQEEVRGSVEGVVRVDLGVEREALLGVEDCYALFNVMGSAGARVGGWVGGWEGAYDVDALLDLLGRARADDLVRGCGGRRLRH